jgi:hypothetical protein
MLRRYRASSQKTLHRFAVFWGSYSTSAVSSSEAMAGGLCASELDSTRLIDARMDEWVSYSVGSEKRLYFSVRFGLSLMPYL